MVNFSRSKLQEWLRRLIKSIAFYPALIGLGFLALSYFSIRFDFSAAGKQIKSQLSWVSLKDASTARSIISAIVSGIISLTVFSFSMVMIVLNQAASQMSNRVLDKLIGNRFQQIVLGIYIGTIVYALFLLSTIRDINTGIYVPALSTYFLILLTVFDIFLFIYFLHYITQSVKYEVIIERIYDATKASLQKTCSLHEEPLPANLPYLSHRFTCVKSGTLEGIDDAALVEFCVKHRCHIEVLPPTGSFVLKVVPILACDVELIPSAIELALSCIRIERAEAVENNYFYGYKQLMEIALKALSPGINDPDTALLSLRALFRLYQHRISFHPQTTFQDEGGQARVQIHERGFEQIFHETLQPIWDYGKDDRNIRTGLRTLLEQLQAVSNHPAATAFLLKVEKRIAKKSRNNNT